MNILTIVGRIGRDAETRETPNGNVVANLAVAYNYGRKDEGGKRPTQWVDASLWGPRAEALQQYLVKGQQVSVALRDVHVRTFDKADGSVGTSLAGDVVEISLIGDAPQRQEAPRESKNQRNSYAEERGRGQQRQQPQRAQQSRGGGSTGFDDMDDDIPFMDPMKRRGFHLVV